MKKGEYVRTRPSKIVCYCPLHEGFHKMAIDWNGNGIPRIYCKQCKHILETRHAVDDEIYQISDRDVANQINL